MRLEKQYVKVDTKSRPASHLAMPRPKFQP